MKRHVVLIGLVVATCFTTSGFASSVASRYSRGQRTGRVLARVAPDCNCLYDNGADDGITAYAISGGYSVANSFATYVPYADVASVSFSNWFVPGDSGSQID